MIEITDQDVAAEKTLAKAVANDGIIQSIRDANLTRNVCNIARRVIKLHEELGEHAEAYLNVTNAGNGKKKCWDDVREEAADLLIVAVDVALTPIHSYDSIERTAWRPWGLDFIPRRFCTAVATTSDGVRRRVDYSVRESLGIIGATVMPHNLYLHSGIVQTRAFGRDEASKREALRLATWDSTIALMFALTVNASILILAAATFAIVPETQQAVVLRLNNPVRLVNQWQPGQVIGRTGAGVIARIPFVDRIVWLDKRVLDADLDNTQVLSTDQLRLNADAYARFRIVDPLRAVTSTGSTSNTEERVADQLRPLLGTALRNELGKVPFAMLLSPERGRVMDAIQASLQHDARQYGVEIVDVRIKHADLPDGSPLDSALQRMRTARQQEANTIRAQGQKAAQIVRAEADASAAKIYADAFSKDAGFYDFYRAMQSYRTTFGVDGGPTPRGSTSIIMGRDNGYLRQFDAGGAAGR